MMSRVATGRGSSVVVEELGAGNSYVKIPEPKGEPPSSRLVRRVRSMHGLMGLFGPGGGAPVDTHDDRESVAAGQAGVAARNAALQAGLTPTQAQQAAIQAAQAVTQKEQTASKDSGKDTTSTDTTTASLTPMQIGIMGAGALILLLGLGNFIRAARAPKSLGYMTTFKRRRRAR